MRVVREARAGRTRLDTLFALMLIQRLAATRVSIRCAGTLVLLPDQDRRG